MLAPVCSVAANVRHLSRQPLSLASMTAQCSPTMRPR
jgi:hypothetical protein